VVTKAVTWVSDISDPDQRGVRYINVAFDDGDTGYLGKKDYDAALEVHGLLTEAMNGQLTQEFILEDTGKKNKKDRTKWKIKGFGEYKNPQPFQGSGGPPANLDSAGPRDRSPGTFTENTWNRDDDIRWAVALKAAAAARPGQPGDIILDLAHLFYAHDFRASVPEANRNGTSTTDSTGAEERAGSGQVGEGEASACPPHQLDFNVPQKAMRYPCLKCGAWVKPVQASGG
jgi:hypothetical protein